MQFSGDFCVYGALINVAATSESDAVPWSFVPLHDHYKYYVGICYENIGVYLYTF